MTTKKFYTPNGWSGSNYDGKLTTKEITQKIREFLKKEYPRCKFSVTRESSGYSDLIRVSVMEAPREIVRDGVTIRPQFRGLIPNDNKTLSNYGFGMLSRIAIYAQSFNYNDNDSMIDYFDCNFFLRLEVGKWNVPFKVVEKAEAKDVQQIEVQGVQLVDYSEKAFSVIGETKPVKDVLKELGGRFNSRLTCGAGWVFPKTKETAVKLALGL